MRYYSCHENIKFISSSQRVMFFLLYKKPMTVFPKIFQNCSKGQTNVPEHFLRISEDIRRISGIHQRILVKFKRQTWYQWNHHWYTTYFYIINYRNIINTCSNTSRVAVCPTATLTQDCKSTSFTVTSASAVISAWTDAVPPSAAAKKRGVRHSLSRGSTEAP